MLRLFVALVIITSFGPNLAIGDEESSKTKTSVEEVQEDKKYSAIVAVRHYMGASEDIDPSTLFVLYPSFHLDKKNKFSIYQELTKEYVINEGESEVVGSDTNFWWHNKMGKTFLDVDVTFRAQLSFPTSQASQRDGVVTKPEVRFYLTKKLFNEKFSVSLIPHARYYFNRYTTTPTDEGDNGGVPLKQAQVASYALVRYNMTEEWGVQAYGGWIRSFYHDAKDNGFDAINTQDKDHQYFVELSTNVSFAKVWELSAGMYQASSAETAEGDVSVVAFDEENSLWFVEVQRSF